MRLANPTYAELPSSLATSLGYRPGSPIIDSIMGVMMIADFGNLRVGPVGDCVLIEWRQDNSRFEVSITRP